MPPHRMSLPEIGHTSHLPNSMFPTDIEPQLLRNGFSQTPSDVNIPMTPSMPNMQHMDNFVSMNGHFDQEAESPFFSMSSGAASTMEYDMSGVLDFVSPPGFMQDFN